MLLAPSAAKGSHHGLSALELQSLGIKDICARARHLLLKEPTLLRLDEGDFVVVGDLHGALGTLQCILERFGSPPERRYLFLGDYVDRGPCGIEVVTGLLLLKLLHPQHIYLLRGNHECERLNRAYGFEQECAERLSASAWRQFLRVFEALPLAAILYGRIFCVHGGLSQELEWVEQIAEVRRPCGIPAEGLLHDLLWTDPAPAATEAAAWGDSVRGPAHYYGRPAVEAFLEENGLQLICRSHSFVQEGYEWRFQNRLITIFSAADYYGPPKNDPAVLMVSADPNIEPQPVLLGRIGKGDGEEDSSEDDSSLQR